MPRFVRGAAPPSCPLSLPPFPLSCPISCPLLARSDAAREESGSGRGGGACLEFRVYLYHKVEG
jgi:hypothetical protein